MGPIFLFEEFPKIPRLKREVTITEKIDGTNAQVALFELNSPELWEEAIEDPFVLHIIAGATDGDSGLALKVGSRTRWLKPNGKEDNFGFAAWVMENVEELTKLGPGRHFGEWYGRGIQIGYDLPTRHFALFNTARWGAHNPNTPSCVQVVPILARGEDVDDDAVLRSLKSGGSVMVPGFMAPEGIVVFHSASRQLYKRTFRDDAGKWRGLT